eukprot:364548-Pyramimonas_sp.AAC.1
MLGASRRAWEGADMASEGEQGHMVGLHTAIKPLTRPFTTEKINSPLNCLRAHVVCRAPRGH